MNLIINKNQFFQLISNKINELEKVKSYKNIVVDMFLKYSYYNHQNGIVLLGDDSSAEHIYGKIFDSVVDSISSQLNKYQKMIDTNIVNSFVIDGDELLKLDSYNVNEIITLIYNNMKYKYETSLSYRSISLSKILKEIHE